MVATAYVRGKSARPAGPANPRDTSNVPEGRWKWLLSLVVVCAVTVVGIWSYAVTLDTWAGSFVTALGVCALLAFVVGAIALSVLISDLVASRTTPDREPG
jgi:hypothetical protein